MMEVETRGGEGGDGRNKLKFRDRLNNTSNQLARALQHEKQFLHTQ
jgi:hypothetical protein